MINRDLLHRVASIVLVLAYAMIAWQYKGGETALRILSGSVLPVACISFPEAMGQFTGRFGQHHIDAPSHPGFLRFLGWFLLIGVPLLVYLLNK